MYADALKLLLQKAMLENISGLILLAGQQDSQVLIFSLSRPAEGPAHLCLAQSTGQID
jgi:hypothetical protein